MGRGRPKKAKVEVVKKEPKNIDSVTHKSLKVMGIVKESKDKVGMTKE